LQVVMILERVWQNSKNTQQDKL